MSNKLILRIDASLLKESSCDLKVVRILLDGYREALSNNDTEFGTAFHIFPYTLAKTNGNEGLALKAAREYYRKPMIIKEKKSYLTDMHLAKVCLDYFIDVYQQDEFKTLKGEDMQPLVELKFAIPYYEDDDVAVLICGTIDDICKREPNGGYAIRDYKTTSQWDKKAFFEQFSLSTQVLLYRWAIKQYGILYPDSVFAKMDRANCAVFIQAIFLGGKDKVEFERSDMIFVKPIMMAEFEQMLYNKVMHIIELAKLWSRQIYPSRQGLINGACWNSFGCKFARACASDSIGEAHYLKNTFIKKNYDPAKFNE